MAVEKSTDTMDEEKGCAGGANAKMLGVKRICGWSRVIPRARWPGATIWLEVWLLLQILYRISYMIRCWDWMHFGSLPTFWRRKLIRVCKDYSDSSISRDVVATTTWIGMLDIGGVGVW
jgi:hypothetical protein